ERARIEPDRVGRRLACQGCLRRIAYPARQSDLGGACFAAKLTGAIVEADQRGASSQDIGQIAFASSVCALRSLDFRPCRSTLLRDSCRHGLGVVPIEPCQSRVALASGNAGTPVGECLGGFALAAPGGPLA